MNRKFEISKVIEQSSNLGAFVSALYNEDYDLISRCIHDIIAEPHRSELIPEFKNLKKIAISNGSIGFGISGSGPSMFSLARGPEKAYFIKRA